MSIKAILESKIREAEESKGSFKGKREKWVSQNVRANPIVVAKLPQEEAQMGEEEIEIEEK